MFKKKSVGTKEAPMKTVPVFGCNAVNLRGNEVFLKAPSGRELSRRD